MNRPEVARLPRVANAAHAMVTRPVYFAAAGGMLETPVFDRYALAPGFASAGPAVLEEYGSTTIVGPHDRFSIGTMREIRIDIGEG
jgi:N-methylhydantoinase A/oxoprolinase/acetone carboxylase beta subunit